MIKVFIVDDHAIVRSGLEQLLATAPDLHLVGAASNGEEALRELASIDDHVDVVLMDLSMPTVDGVTATAEVVRSYPGTRVLVLTSFGDQQRIVDALSAGADGYLLKHTDPDQLLDAIRAVHEGGAPMDPKASRVLLNARQLSQPRADLTDRETQVLLLVRAGLANKQIARQLGISERTVKAHLTRVFQSLGVTDRTQAALWAAKHLPPDRSAN